jgi:hypothetical protein
MTWTPIVGKALALPELQKHINSLSFNNWKPSVIIWHNTGLPTIQQWEKSYQDDLKRKLEPGITRINSLEHWFKIKQGWKSAPHWFVYKDKVWAFTPSNKKGTGSPSWNGTGIHIEMIADFSKEDDDSGDGLLIKNNTIALTAMLCDKIGLKPESGEVISEKPFRTTGTIFLHKQDPRTTHDCPGHDIAVDKDAMIDSVLEYMGHGGDHTGSVDLSVIKKRNGFVNVAHNDYLNLRENSSASSKIITKLHPDTKITILNEAMNSNTKWLYISVLKYKGWVAARYIKEI